jgi:hypothetical protein
MTQRSLLDASASWQPEDLAEVWRASEGRWLAGLLQGKSVLDVSPAPNAATAELAEGAASLVVVTPRAAVAHALADRLPSAVEVRTAEPGTLPFADGSFNVAVCLGAGRIGPSELGPMIAELVRVVGADGFVVVSLGPADARSPVWGPDHRSAVGDLVAAHVSSHSAVDLRVSLSLDFATEGLDLGPPDGVTEPDAEGGWTAPAVLDTIVIGANGPLPEPPARRSLRFGIDAAVWQAGQDRMLEVTRVAQARAVSAEAAADERLRLIGELFLVEQRLSEEFDRRRRQEVSPRAATTFRDQLVAARADQDRIEELELEVERLRDAVEGANAYIAELKSSTSWVVTKPLRGMKRLLR